MMKRGKVGGEREREGTREGRKNQLQKLVLD